MFCTRCGGSNSEGNAFCVHCGELLRPAAPKKKKTGLIIVLIVGIVVLLGAAAIYFFLLSGKPITGLWYDEDNAVVLEFRDGGNVTGYNLAGTWDATYEYDQRSGEGILKSEGIEDDFTAANGKIDFGKSVFKRADNDFNTREFLSGCLDGVYANGRGEVIELRSGHTAIMHDSSGVVSGKFNYDFENGTGTITISGTDYTFSSDPSKIEIDNYGIYKKEAEGFDIDRFVAESNSLTGDWYDIQGMHGQFTFAPDGTLQFLSYKKIYTGTYTYDSSAGSGTITANGLQGDFTLSGSALTVKGTVITLSGDTVTTGGVMFMKEYKEQEDNAFVYIEGTWYDGAGLRGSIAFNKDGTVVYTEDGTILEGTASYNPFTLTGTITISATGETIAFSQMNGRIYADNSEYLWSQSGIEQHPGSIASMWYDKAGHLGTLTFLKDGTAAFYNKPDDSNYSGTYTFDAASGTGSFTVNVNGAGKTYSISLSNGLISLNNGEAYFTTIFTSQIN